MRGLPLRRTLALLLLPCFVACGDDGGGRFCTEIGCTDGLTLRLLAPETGFADGSYVAAVTLGDDTSTCTWEVSGAVSGECETTVFTSTEIALTFMSTPAEVSLELTRDGSTVVTQALTPDYDTVQPNGPDCEPTCRQAVIPIEL